MKRWSKPEIKAELNTRKSILGNKVQGFACAWKNGCIYFG